jgi:RimJ/RimL family protein N-acetyltransferase
LWLLALGVSDVRACVHPDHVASRHVAEKAGLRLTDEIIDGEQVWVHRAP